MKKEKSVEEHLKPEGPVHEEGFLAVMMQAKTKQGEPIGQDTTQQQKKRRQKKKPQQEEEKKAAPA